MTIQGGIEITSLEPSQHSVIRAYPLKNTKLTGRGKRGTVLATHKAPNGISEFTHDQP